MISKTLMGAALAVALAATSALAQDFPNKPIQLMVAYNIVKHMAPGGYFIASTTETSDIHEGLELHQTQWTNAGWRAWVSKNYPDLEYVDVGLVIYQFVRYNFIHPSFLICRKKDRPAVR